MRRFPLAVSLLTLLLFIFSLTGNVLIADPAFSSVAFADEEDGKIKLNKSAKKKKDQRDGDKDNDNNGIPGKITALQAEIDALEQELTNIELTPGPPGEPGTDGSNGTNGLDGAPGPQGDPGTDGTNGTNGIDGVNGTNGTNGSDGAPGSNGTNGTDGIDGTNGTNCTNGLDGDTGPAGPTGAQGDCDNTNASVFPGAPEVCGYGVDNDCNGIACAEHACGSVAVDCQVSALSAWTACTASCGGGTSTRTRTVTVQPANGGQACPQLTETQACNTQPCPDFCQGVPTSLGCVTGLPGVCSSGMQTRTCDSSTGQTSAWSVCESDTQPSTEVCGDGIDNNCDGQVDENAVTPTECADACGNPEPAGTSCGFVFGQSGCSCDGAGSCIPFIFCAPGETTCSSSQTAECVDLNIDNNNCGACGNICQSGSTCINGVCQ